MSDTLKGILRRGPKFEENILNAFESRKIVFFIGAGVSRIMGIQGWNDFSASLIKKAFPEYKDYVSILRDIPDNKERITIAYKKFEQENRLQEFYDFFGECMKPNPEIFSKKRNIYEVLNRFDAFFLTTNADNLFEDVLGNTMCHEDYDLAIIQSEHHRKQNHLFYLHGHYTKEIDIEDNNLVFTAPQYIKRYNDPRFVDFLKGVFQGDNVIVFIGYGLNEVELIDYIVTKVGYTDSVKRKVYLLYGFCENEDVLYKAKKAYFEALNIGLIEYDIGEKGYDALIDVLVKLQEDCRKETIIPVTEIISKCINEYNEENYLTILRYLKNENLVYVNEPQIVREIIQLGTCEWTRRFYEDGLFSSKQMEKKLIYGAWPLLELFVKWVEWENENAQNAAVSFLDQISENQISKMIQTYTYINRYIIQIVLSLDKTHINPKYIDLICLIGERYNYFHYELCKISNFQRMRKWNLKDLRYLFDCIFKEIDIDTYRSEKYYAIDRYFKAFNHVISNYRIIKFVFTYFEKLIRNTSGKNNTLFARIYDLEHIYKNHQEYWILVFDEINFTFSKMTQKQQKEILKRMFSNKSEASWKLGLYLSRKYDHNVSYALVKRNIIDSSLLFHELYLTLKHHVEKDYFLESEEEILCDSICNTQFGLEKHGWSRDREYFENVILSRKLLLLQLFSNVSCQIRVEHFKSLGVKPYPSIEIAEECDYIHSGTWVNEKQINRDTFKNTDLKKWVGKLAKECEKLTDSISLIDCGRQFASVLLDMDEDERNVIIPTLKEAPNRLICSILQEFRANIEKFITPDVLVEACLELLNRSYYSADKEVELAKDVFSLLELINIQDKASVLKTLQYIQPWLEISLDDVGNLENEQDIVNCLINLGDFDKFSVFINCYVALRKIDGYKMTKDEVEQFFALLKRDTSRVFRYTLCYHFVKMKYITNTDSNIIINEMINICPFDMTALLLCVYNSKYVFSELVEKIKVEYLYKDQLISFNYREDSISNQFYSYIIAACYLKKLTFKEFSLAYKNEEFIKYFLENINRWADQEDFIAEEWLNPCWEYIKENLADIKIQQFAALMCRTIDMIRKPTEKIMDMYIEAIGKCGEDVYLYLNLSKLSVFFDRCALKARILVEAILRRKGYIDIKNLRIIISKYKENDMDREAKILLNMLTEKGEISTKEREDLAQLL